MCLMYLDVEVGIHGIERHLLVRSYDTLDLDIDEEVEGLPAT